jgi:alpha-mannosidase
MRSQFAVTCLLLLLATPLPTQAQDLVIERWLINGPIPAPADSSRVIRDYLGGEASAMPTLGDPGWREIATDGFGRLDLNDAFAGSNTAWSTAYAHSYVFSPEDRTVLLVGDSDDDLTVHVNGQRVWLNVVARGLGRGNDTIPVRLAEGWNSLLFKVLNRAGGFGILGRLAPAEIGGVEGLLLSIARPPGMIAHNYPHPTVTLGPVRLGPTLSWEGDRLSASARASVVAWGPDTFRGVSMQLSQAGRDLGSSRFDVLAQAEPVEVELPLPFADLRRAAIGEAPIVAGADWQGGSREAAVFVDAAQLLRLVGGRIELGSLEIDSGGGSAGRMNAQMTVPSAFDGQTVEMLALGLGPGADYRVNGRATAWSDGKVTLCAPCRAGDSLRIAIVPEAGRPVWRRPMARVREIGYPEYADGYAYAEALASRRPPIESPDAIAWLRHIGDPGADAYRALVRRYQEAYAPLAAEVRRDTLHLIGNSHIDAAWLWPWSETIDVIRDTWRTSLKLAELFPGYIFSGSSGAYYDAMDRLEPALADSLVAAIESGKWMPVGGWWVESDLNVPSGESLVRQGLYGQRYFEQRFGFRSKVAWTPDCFGYPWTNPQILKGAGLDYFVTPKLRWNDSTEFPHNAFYWQGLDGTRVLTYNPYGYVHDLDPGKLVTERLEDRERTGLNHQIVLYGVGDHGGGPTIAMLQRAEDLRRVPTFPVMVYAEPLSALEAVKGSDESNDLPVWNDELYLEYHRGTYTTQARSKWRNRRSEAMLQAAEALATVGSQPYPRERLEDAWRLILFNQFHDILPGSGIREVYEDAEVFYDSAWAVIDSVKAGGFAELRALMDTRGRDETVVVFNPLGWSRSGVVTVLPAGSPDTSTPSQRETGQVARLSRRGLPIAVEDIPAFGAKVVRMPRDTMPKDVRRLPAPTAGSDWLENAFLRVEIDPRTGDITRIFDKVNEREALAPGGRGNVLQVLDDRPDQWDAWNIVITGDMWEVGGIYGLSAVADPWKAELRLERRWGNSTFHQRLVLARDARYLDVQNEFDWREERKALKVAFSLNVEADSATFEIPYGTVRRTGRPRTKAERAKFEVPGQRWADVSQEDYGVSILNDSKYGWDYKANVLRLTLLRSPLWPDSLADRGAHSFRFAVYPHAGDWRAAETVRRAAEYNVPMLAAYEPEHKGQLGKEASFASADPANVELTWLKRAEDSDNWVLRLVEWHGTAAEVEATVACPVQRAWRANLLEDPTESVKVNGRRMRLSLRPYEIATLLVECKR